MDSVNSGKAKEAVIDGKLEEFSDFLKQLQRDYVPDKPLDYAKYFNSLNTVADLMYVNNYLKNEIVFSRGFETFLGLPSMPKNGFELYNLVHPEDLGDILLATSASVENAASMTPEEAGDFIFVADYRIRKGDNSYARILRQSSILESRNDLGVITTVSLCTDISNVKMHGPVTARVTGSRAKGFLDILNRKKAGLGGRISSLDLSNREQEILHLISQGMRSQDIADKFHVSVHTVNTHRRNMLKKLEVKTMAELLIKVLA